HGEVQAVERDQIECRHVEIDLELAYQVVQRGGVVEGEVPGVEAAPGGPPGTPVPMLGEAAEPLERLPTLVEAALFPGDHAVNSPSRTTPRLVACRRCVPARRPLGRLARSSTARPYGRIRRPAG